MPVNRGQTANCWWWNQKKPLNCFVHYSNCLTEVSCHHFLISFQADVAGENPHDCFQTKPIKRIMQIVWKRVPLTVWTATDNQTIGLWSLQLSFCNCSVGCVSDFLETDRCDSDSLSVCFSFSSCLSRKERGCQGGKMTHLFFLFRTIKSSRLLMM